MLPATQPSAPASAAPQRVKGPPATVREPANGMITSDGKGMQALSMAINPPTAA